ncbi:MAG TPA: hypothetical protein VGT40_26000 [Methylomirabilota bacterium]|jgi:hypothetical protein|nr:hypothetical protein [Methylomirabilota bacterium]
MATQIDPAPNNFSGSAWRRSSITVHAPGPPLSERPPLIADLDTKIADVDEQYSQLVDQAHRPPG